VARVQVLATNAPALRNVVRKGGVVGLEPIPRRVVAAVQRTGVKAPCIKACVFPIHLERDHDVLALKGREVAKHLVIAADPLREWQVQSAGVFLKRHNEPHSKISEKHPAATASIGQGDFYACVQLYHASITGHKIRQLSDEIHHDIKRPKFYGVLYDFCPQLFVRWRFLYAKSKGVWHDNPVFDHVGDIKDERAPSGFSVKNGK